MSEKEQDIFRVEKQTEEPKNVKAPQMPTFAELKMALPEELRDEFQKLGEDVEKTSSAKGGAMDGREIGDELLSSEEKKIFARHSELQKMAMDKLQRGKSDDPDNWEEKVSSYEEGTDDDLMIQK